MESDPQLLNDQYAIPGHIKFTVGENNLLTAVVDNDFAAAAITLAGAHVMTYTPHGEPPVLWASPNAAYTLGLEMRGGIPVCWPWFASHPEEPHQKPLHGLVRTMLWNVRETRVTPEGATEVRMFVEDTPETRSVWPHPFELETVITVGQKLRVEWFARNPGDQVYTYTGALHPYFAVSDINAVEIHGLEKMDYLDKPEGFRRKTQTGAIRFAGEVNRIYLNTTADIAIQDPGLGRTIHIAKQGSHTSVVWNPHQSDASMADVGAGQHRSFVCVEPANAAEDVTTVAPGGEAHLAMIIWTDKGAAL